MKLLVSTFAKTDGPCGLFLVDTESSRIRHLAGGITECRGFAFHGDCLFASGKIPERSGFMQIVEFEWPSMEPLGYMEWSDDIHGVAYHDGYVYTVCATNDHMYKWDLEDGSYEGIPLHKNTPGRNHYNDLVMTPDGWRFTTFGDFNQAHRKPVGAICSLSGVVVSGLNQPHSIDAAGNYCNSGCHEVVVAGETHKFSGFTRGLCVADEVWVGVSRRDKKQCWIERLEDRKRICLPNGEIYQVSKVV